MRQDAADTGTWEYREDRGELLRPVRRGNTLLVEGVAAREGVLEYRRADGSIRRELVRADTLKRAATSLARAPVTLLHPDPRQHPQGVTEDNYGELGVGDVDGEVLIGDGGFTRVKMALRRRDAIEAVEKGDARELSCGYRVQLDETPGEHPVYGRYDAEQISRTHNHLAVVPNARAGHEAHVRADGAVATTVISAGESPASNPSGARPRGATVNARFLPLLTLLGVTSAVNSDDAAIDAALNALGQRKDSADRADADHKAALAAEKARADGEKARADAAEAKVRTLEAADKARADAAERTELDATAKAFGIDPAKHQESRALKLAIASKHLGFEVKADESDEYLRVALGMARKALEDRGQGRADGARAFAPPAGGSGSRHDAPFRGSGGGGGRRPSIYQRVVRAQEAARKAGGSES